MSGIYFNDVTFTYPLVEGDLDAEGKQIIPSPVFEHFTGEIPLESGGRLVSLTGPNASGKSTFMLLASGRLVPQSGTCTLFDKNLSTLSEEQKNLAASVIYQNMEFESEESVLSLLTYVYKNGALKGKAESIYSEKEDLFNEITKVFELESVFERGLVNLSKGELQRVLVAFSLLYGSASVFMDEPFFAMEEKQKENSLSYLKDFTRKTGTIIVLSMHELDLTKKYADRVLLFYPNRDMSFGTPEEVLTDEELEKAYGIPASMLKHQESMTREQLAQESEVLRAKG